MPNPPLILTELFRFDAWIASCVSLAVCVLLILTKRWHGEFSMDSAVGIQKMHTNPTPRIGGVAIALGILVGFADSSHDPAAYEKRAILAGIILAGIPAFVFGLLEDLTKRVSVRTRLLATMGSGLVGWGITGVSLNHVAIPGLDWLLSYTLIAVLFTAFAVGGIANAINIIDGFNGLAAGTSLIILATFGVIARLAGDVPLAFSCLVIAGAVAGFLLVNWPFGKIFLGDGGAYFLGFALAWIAVLLPNRNPDISPWTSLLICIYPIIEVVVSYIRRSRRTGHHPSQPDRVHLHHLVNRRIVRKYFPTLSRSTQNGITASFMWPLAAIPAALAISTRANPDFIIAAVSICVVVYSVSYRRLACYRWL